MTKGDQYKDEICRLYRLYNLEDVKAIMEKQHGFEASISWYRKRLRDWKERKIDNARYDSPTTPAFSPGSEPPSIPLPHLPRPQRPVRTFSPARASFGSHMSSDSGYCTDPYRLSTSTTGSSQLRVKSPAHKALALPSTNDLPPLPHQATISVDSGPVLDMLMQFPEPPPFQNIFGTSRPVQQPQSAQRKKHWPLRKFLSSDQLVSPLSVSNVKSCHVAPTQAYSASDISSFNNNAHASHPPRSRCVLAGNLFYTPNLEMGPCQGCGASKAHYVAAIARTFPSLDILKDQIKSIKPHMQDIDIFGNIPLHFIASSGPTSVEQLKLFISCREDQYWSNLNGECYLHTLDPSGMEAALPCFLQELCDRDKPLLRARTYDGRTVLHCILAQVRDMSTVGKVLPIFKSAHVSMHARNNEGKTAFDLLCERWSSHSLLRTPEQLNQLKRILACHVPNMKLVCCGDKILLVTVPPNSTPEEIQYIYDGQSPGGRYSDDFSHTAQARRYREMRDLTQESLRNPLAQDYRGRNGLHCFAHRLDLMSESENMAEVCKQDLIELLGKGVDPNEYDMNKQTPLHVLLSAHHNPQSQTRRGFLSNVLIDRGTVRNPEIIHMRDGNGDTPLHLSCKAGLVSCVVKLLTYPVDVNALNCSGHSVIYEAKQAKTSKNPKEAAKIQSCIELVEKSNGKEDPELPELRLWNGDMQSAHCASLFRNKN